MKGTIALGMLILLLFNIPTFAYVSTKIVVLERKENFLVRDWWATDYQDLSAGNTLVISWNASVDMWTSAFVYVFNESQSWDFFWHHYEPWIPISFLAGAEIKSGIEGSLSFVLPYTGKYYVWIENTMWVPLQLVGPPVWMYYYQAELVLLPPPTAPVVTVDVDPDTLNLRSKGQWITAYIELPKDYNLGNIDISTLKLNGTVPVDPSAPITTGDHDSDGIPDLTVKFNRAELILYIYDVQKIKYGNVTLTLTGQLNDGTLFEGKDVIMVMLRGDVNNDRIIDILDLALIARALGTDVSYPKGTGWDQWNPNADLNLDNKVDVYDLSISGSGYGATIP